MVLIVSQNTVFSQVVVNFGSITNFISFTSAGAIANTGASAITGDVGSGFAAIALTGATHSGTVYSQDATTAQANLDLISLYTQLMCVPNTNLNHLPVFGGGETLTPGVYAISAAGSLAATVTLNGNGNSDAVFIIKFGAAFVVSAASNIILTNSARACNVFWIAEGAVSIGAGTTMIGNVISHNGEIAMGASGNLVGRLLTLNGAIAFGPFIAQKPTCNSTAITNCINPNTPAFCYTINTRSCALFNLFTSTGAIGNTASSDVTGDIGTNSGAIAGFGSSTVNGTFQNANAVTMTAKLDLDSLYLQLISVPVTNNAHAPAFGANEVLTPGVYQVAGAGSIAGNLYLNGQFDSNTVFIFKFGGAFATAGPSSIFLINGARSCNVFWVAEGAISFGAGSATKGTFVSNSGAIAMADGATFEGRLLTRAGAISIDNVESITFPDCECILPNPLPINLVDFSGECLPNRIRLNWETATETNNDYFSIERSDDGISWSEVGTISGAGNSSSSRKYFLDDLNQYNEVSYYRLKQHDFSGISRTFSPISMQNCFNGNEALSIYPNPASNVISINFNGDVGQIANSTIVDLSGRNMYQSSIYQSSINTEDYQDGIYFLQLNLKSGNITRKFLIAK